MTLSVTSHLSIDDAVAVAVVLHLVVTIVADGVIHSSRHLYRTIAVTSC